MRIVGMFLLGLGIMLLILTGVALTSVTRLTEVIGFLLCMGFVLIPMIVGGIVIIRRVEDKLDKPPPPGPVDLSRWGRRAGANPRTTVEPPVPNLPSLEHQTAPPQPSSPIAKEPSHRILKRMRSFELNRLNWIGWLLLLTTIGFAIAETVILPQVLENKAWSGRLGTRWIGLGMAFLAIAFFVGLRWLLRLFGISIYRW